MKKIFYIIVIILPLTTIAQLRFDWPIKVLEPVELIARYSLEYQQDSTNKNFIRQEDMLLFLGESTSSFMSNLNFMYDTMIRNIATRSEFRQLISDPSKPLPISAILYRIFKNHPKGKLTCIEHIIDGTFKYTEDLSLFNWKLTTDTITINGYKAQKATCNFAGRNWIAWFSPEIPYNDGPYKFNGLPGLIVKLYDTQMHYYFELESIEAPEQNLMIDYKVKNFFEVNKQDFFRAKDSFREDIIDRAKAAGLNSEAQQNAALNMAERNNPIELERK